MTACENHIDIITIERIEVLVGCAMKRDDDLIRKILLEMEAEADPVKIYTNVINADPEQRRIYFHVLLLEDAGFVTAVSPGKQVFRITNAGHDFLAAIRDDTVWNKTKAASAKIGGVGLGLLRDVAIGYVRAKLVEAGVPLA